MHKEDGDVTFYNTEIDTKNIYNNIVFKGILMEFTKNIQKAAK